MGVSCCSRTAANLQTTSGPRTRLQSMGDFKYIVYRHQLIGTGCKQSMAWETKATQQEVQRKREQFWYTRTEGNHQAWMALKAAIQEPDPQQAAKMIGASGLLMVNGDLRAVYDQNHYRYVIPVFVINEPKSYGSQKKKLKRKVNFEQQEITIVLRSSRFGDQQVNISNYIEVGELKNQVKMSKGLDGYGIRMFFNGKELADNIPIGQYKIFNRYVVQTVVVPINEQSKEDKTR